MEYVPTLINEEWIILDWLRDKTRNIKKLCVIGFVFNIVHVEIHTKIKLLLLKMVNVIVLFEIILLRKR